MEVEGWAGFGRKGWPQFWFGAGDGARKPMLIAFVAENRAKMRAFYEAALRAGAKDNGPQVSARHTTRTNMAPSRLALMVTEAVCHEPES